MWRLHSSPGRDTDAGEKGWGEIYRLLDCASKRQARGPMAAEAARLGQCRPMAGGDWGGDWRGAGPVEGGARGWRRRRRRLQQRRRRPRQKRPGSRQVRSAGLRAGGGQAGRGRVRGGPTCWQRSRCVPRSASGCAHGASERGAGRAPSAHRRRRSRPSVPLSLRVAGLEPRAAPELPDFRGGKVQWSVCVQRGQELRAGPHGWRTGGLEGWWWRRRRGAGRAGAACPRGTKMCQRYQREASPCLLPGLGFLHLKETASGTPLPSDPVHPQVGSRSSPDVPGDNWKAWR